MFRKLRCPYAVPDVFSKIKKMAVLHTLSDGAVVKRMLASDLIRIPVWKGNRIIDHAHVEEIARAVGTAVQKLDFGYRIISLEEHDAEKRPILVKYLIDGQHRARVVSDVLSTSGSSFEDFHMIVLEKQVASELEAIAYFRELNATKSIDYRDDNLTCNKYMEELLKLFNTSRRHPNIRQGRTARPYLSVEKLRETLLEQKAFFSEDISRIRLFATQTAEWNNREKLRIELFTAYETPAAYIQKAIEIGFVLGLDVRMRWVAEVFRQINGIH